MTKTIEHTSAVHVLHSHSTGIRIQNCDTRAISMTGRRKLYTGDETAIHGLIVLRLAALGGLLVTAIFIFFFERAKHDPALAGVNPFAEDPYDAVGSFGVQIGFVCAGLGLLRAFRTNVKTESLYNRYTYTLRSIAVSQLAIIVTMLGNLVAGILNLRLWIESSEGRLLIVFAATLLLVAALYCRYLIRLANRREVCSKNPLRQRQIVPAVILLVLLGAYPISWREGIAGAVVTASAGMIFLFLSVALLSRAMFPCPDVPEKDLLDDLNGICQGLTSRFRLVAGFWSSIKRLVGASGINATIELFNPRNHQWRFLALSGFLMGFLLAVAELFGGGATPGAGQILRVALVFIALESAGVFLGFALLRRFLGLIRFENAKY
jgi:hypothetical protein